MKIFRAADRDAPIERRATFTGDVLLMPLFPPMDGVTASEVVFAPSARSYWHSHENGQLLLITAGRGFVCAQGERPSPVTTGDIVWTPPGQRHWHGAGPDSCLVHTAVSLGTTSWNDPVSDAEYTAQPSEGAVDGHRRDQ